MDFRVLLVFLLPAFATAGMYSGGPFSVGTGFSHDYNTGGIGELGLAGGDKGEGEMENYEKFGDEGTISASAEIVNQGNAYASAAADEYDMKAKAIEEKAKMFRSLVDEKRLLLGHVKKRVGVLRAQAEESLQAAEQLRSSAAEKSQKSKALETKAHELEKLSKDQDVQSHELKQKVHAELKQYLQSLISSNVAEANAEINRAVMERKKFWGMYLEKQAQDMIAESVKWERTSADSKDKARKLKTEASVEGAKAQEFEKKRKELEARALEAQKKANEFYYFLLEFELKAEEEALQAELARTKAKYLQTIGSSMAESAQDLGMFANMQDKDKKLWEKKTAEIKNEVKQLENSANKKFSEVEKIKKLIKSQSKKTSEKQIEIIKEEKEVKVEPQPKIEVKKEEVPKEESIKPVIVSEKKA